MRVALAQIDVTVGDIQGNTVRAIQAVATAQEAGAGFILLPELTTTGYPPEDLLAKDHFVEENLDALEQIAAACGNAAIVGFVDKVEGQLYNAAALCGNGRVLQVYHKRRLPNYGVFDERRYFVPGELPGLFELGGDDVREHGLRGHLGARDRRRSSSPRGPGSSSTSRRARITPARHTTARQMLRERARENDIWLAYCNLVGGQDELVFDGRSAVFAPSGEVVARAAAFEEDLVIVDFTPGGQAGRGRTPHRSSEPDEEVYRALVLGLRDYVRKNGFTDVVVGLSGGIDSALTATVAADALGAEHVHGVLMPSRYSSEGSVTDARALAELLGIEALELPIEGAVRGVPRDARRRVRGTRDRRDRGEPPGAGTRHAAHGAVEQVRLARARHGQQERALGRLLDALRRHGRRLRAAQGRASRRASTTSRAGATGRRRRDSRGDHHQATERRAADRTRPTRTRFRPTTCSTGSSRATWSGTGRSRRSSPQDTIRRWSSASAAWSTLPSTSADRDRSASRSLPRRSARTAGCR